MKKSEKYGCYYWLETFDHVESLIVCPTAHDGSIHPEEAAPVTRQAFSDEEWEEFIAYIAKFYGKPLGWVAGVVNG